MIGASFRIHRFMGLLVLVLAMRLPLEAAEKNDLPWMIALLPIASRRRRYPVRWWWLATNGHIIFHKAYGNRSLMPTRETMTEKYRL